MSRRTSARPTPAFSVALVGADGAGKTTIARRLEREHPLPVRYLYMGLNPAAGNALLPTTRLLRRLRPQAAAAAGGPPNPARARPRAGVRSWLRVGNLLAEEWYRQARAWGHLRRGEVVVFDRHYLSDYWAHDIRAARSGAATDRPSVPLSRRVHGFLLARAYPRPDLTICLDAPAEVLFARKPEGTVDLVARRRQEYLDLASQGGDVIVLDASRPIDDVAADVFGAVSDFAAAPARRGRR